MEELILAFKELGIDIDKAEATKLLERYERKKQTNIILLQTVENWNHMTGLGYMGICETFTDTQFEFFSIVERWRKASRQFAIMTYFGNITLTIFS